MQSIGRILIPDRWLTIPNPYFAAPTTLVLFFTDREEQEFKYWSAYCLCFKIRQKNNSMI